MNAINVDTENTGQLLSQYSIQGLRVPARVSTKIDRFNSFMFKYLCNSSTGVVLTAKSSSSGYTSNRTQDDNRSVNLVWINDGKWLQLR